MLTCSKVGIQLRTSLAVMVNYFRNKNEIDEFEFQKKQEHLPPKEMFKLFCKNDENDNRNQSLPLFLTSKVQFTWQDLLGNHFKTLDYFNKNNKDNINECESPSREEVERNKFLDEMDKKEKENIPFLFRKTKNGYFLIVDHLKQSSDPLKMYTFSLAIIKFDLNKSQLKLFISNFDGLEDEEIQLLVEGNIVIEMEEKYSYSMLTQLIKKGYIIPFDLSDSLMVQSEVLSLKLSKLKKCKIDTDLFLYPILLDTGMRIFYDRETSKLDLFNQSVHENPSDSKENSILSVSEGNQKNCTNKEEVKNDSENNNPNENEGKVKNIWNWCRIHIDKTSKTIETIEGLDNSYQLSEVINLLQNSSLFLK